MARITCPNCEKTFRTQTGLNWHKWHIHELPKSEGKPPKELPACQQCYQEGYSRGYEQGKKDWQIWYFCDVCKERIDVSPNANSHQALITYMKEHGWGHTRCHEKG
jgi:hypothetical protein